MGIRMTTNSSRLSNVYRLMHSVRNLKSIYPIYNSSKKKASSSLWAARLKFGLIFTLTSTSRPLKDRSKIFSGFLIQSQNCILCKEYLKYQKELIALSKQNEGVNEKRRKQLEQFIQILAQRQEMRRSNLFFDFLTVPADKF